MTQTSLIQPVARFLMLGTLLSMIGCKTFTISERDMILPDQRVEDAAATRQQQIERFIVPTEHGDIAVTRVSRPGNSVSVLYCGGNQFRTSQMGGEVVRAFPVEADLVMFDYPGYGGSTGKPTLATMLETSVAVYDAAKARTTQPMVVYGASMGGFMAAHVAGARNPPRLVLEATAPDTQQWVKSLIPWFGKPFVRTQLAESIAGIDNVGKLKTYGGPVLMMVGSRDTQTRPKLMQSYAAALRGQGKQVGFIEIDGRGHGQLLDVERIRAAIADFVTTGNVP